MLNPVVIQLRKPKCLLLIERTLGSQDVCLGQADMTQGLRKDPHALKQQLVARVDTLQLLYI